MKALSVIQPSVAVQSTIDAIQLAEYLALRQSALKGIVDFEIDGTPFLNVSALTAAIAEYQREHGGDVDNLVKAAEGVLILYDTIAEPEAIMIDVGLESMRKAVKSMIGHFTTYFGPNMAALRSALEKFGGK
jgi:hypothetical protein